MSMNGRMIVTRSVLLGTTALFALSGCLESSSGGGGAVPSEVGVFGYVVGTPVAVISSTRGEGASADFDQFEVTFNNADGTDITITTPEGEEINFSEADSSTWVGVDEDLSRELADLPGGDTFRGDNNGDDSGVDELARLVSEDGDLLEVFIGTIDVPVAPNDDNEEGYDTGSQLVFGAARLDEQDTREGFETYMVTGELTDVANLPRYRADVFEEVEGEQVLVHSEGDLIEGTAYYNGGFVASVYKEGELLSDNGAGWTEVDIDFAANFVAIRMGGTYRYDDLDDVAPQAVTGINVFDTPVGLVTDVVPTYGPINVPGDPAVELVVTDIQEILDGDGVGTGQWEAIYAPLNQTLSEDIVTAIQVSYSDIPILDDPDTPDVDESRAAFTVVENVTVKRDLFENEDFLSIELDGSGLAGDINFEEGVTYSGALEGEIEVQRDPFGNTELVDVGGDAGEGQFGGAVFGPGDAAFTDLTVDPEYLPAITDEILSATATAGVFEANNDGDPDDFIDPGIEIVGAFGTDAGYEAPK